MKVSNNGKIEYSNISQPNAVFGVPIGRNPYKYDENGNITSYPEGLINAIDINWGGASVKDSQINTTDDLLDLINGLGSGGGTIDSNSVIPIMLSAIRALQAEVVKLRNSFVDGIYSCTGKETKMSATNYSLSDIDAEEPLWAIDETTLSEILYVNLGLNSPFENTENVIVNLENDTVTFNKLTYWEDTDHTIENVILGNTLPNIGTENQTIQPMPKTYVYLKSTGLDITFYLKNIDDETDIISIPLNRLVNANDQNLYNILCVIATSIKEEKNNVVKYYGKNFCWIQVGHYIYDGIQQGYYNKELTKLQDNEITFDDKRYVINKIGFNNLTLSKLAFYIKYQNFSNEVESINPNYDTRYKTAHITIRAIDTYDDLIEIKDQLPENELIYVESGNFLCIKNGYKIKKLGLGGTTPDGGEDNPDDIDTMTNKELIEALKQMGIVYEHYSENADTNDYDLELAALSSVTFVHEATGKKFDISVDAYGKLKSVEQGDTKTLIERIGENNINDIMGRQSVRGFVTNVRAKESNKNAGDDSDMKLLADRIKIGAIYAPIDSEEVHGCSHAFIELENTSDKDFPLDDCYLHYCKWNNTETKYDIYHLALDGYIPKGGTYLIRGKKYTKAEEDANVFIHVDSYDKEWYHNGELIDFTMNDEVGVNTHSWSFALTYKNENIIESTQLYVAANASNIPAGETAVSKFTDQKVYKPGFIDAISIGSSSQCKWAGAAFSQTKNCIYKNTFELDPAKQAFNALHPKDSSRTRWKNAATDFQYVMLNKDIIEFPHTDLVKHVADYTPKASFENKNVCTDKTKFDLNKPNMPTVSFGMDAFKTRCFNWLSAGQFDEYVFIKQDNNTWKVFESYKQRGLSKKDIYTPLSDDIATQLSSVPENATITKTVTGYKFEYSKTTDVDISTEDLITFKYKDGDWKSYTKNGDVESYSDLPPAIAEALENVPENATIAETPSGYKFSYSTKYTVEITTNDTIDFKYSNGWKSHSIEDYDKEYESYQNNLSFPVRKEYSYDICNIAFCGLNYLNNTLTPGKRVSNIFPASNIFYTSHKCVIDILSDDEINNLNEPKTYTYVVGRADKTGKAPDFDYCSKEMHFTMYPKSYTPRVYQTTDQQGFHWIEYQVWGACAKKLNEIINEDCQNNNIIPVLINTGDMTQSGARINEWLDYYNAGECLFDHLEQMNIVGNNDLCGTDVTALGTGDDPGKSNGYFYYICYCYDIPNNREIVIDTETPENSIYNIAPIVNNTIIPSLYYFDFQCTDQTYRMCMINSEITLVNCKEWFGLACDDNYTANIYTGFKVRNKFEENMQVEQTYVADEKQFTPIYTILYYMLNCHKTSDNIKYLVYCHEMPFTVITHANIAPGKCGIPRSVNGNNGTGSSMVGSKLNHIVWWENAANGCPKGLHWFSRLLEYKGIKLCIGGHKHTYCVTYPLREYYKYDFIYYTAEEAAAINEQHINEEGWTNIKEGDLKSVKSSLTDGPMTMTPSLENDDISFVWKETITYRNANLVNNKDVDHTKFPLTYRDNVGVTNDSSILYPYTYTNDAYNNHAVVYFMCQATGYKLTSNKELPTAQQKFTRVLPKTNNTTEKPHNDQKYSMFAVYELSLNDVKIKLGRIHEIFNDSAHTFTQLSYSSNDMYISYMKRDNVSNDYGEWVKESLLNDKYIFNKSITWEYE